MGRSCSQPSYLRGAFTAVGACGYRCCLGLAGGIHDRVALQVSLTLLVNWRAAINWNERGGIYGARAQTVVLFEAGWAWPACHSSSQDSVLSRVAL